MMSGIDWKWETFPEYLANLERLPKGINYGAEVAAKVHKELHKLGGVKPPKEFVLIVITNPTSYFSPLLPKFLII